MKTVLATYADNEPWLNYCAKPLERSAKHFHPELDFVIFGPEEMRAIYESDSFYDVNHSKHRMGQILSADYDRVVIFDSDSLIVGPLTELLESDCEVAGVRNNNDYSRAGCSGPFRTTVVYDGTIDQYLNCGLVVVTNPAVWDRWEALDREWVPKKILGMAEQDTWNLLFYDYQHLVLDSREKRVFYGIAGQWGTVEHYDNWKEIRRDGDTLYVNSQGVDKVIKVLHRAGSSGAGDPQDKFNPLDHYFSPKVVEFLQGILT